MLDTNVLSALMRDRPDPAVVLWLDRQDPVDVWTSAISVFEIRFGLARLPSGRRRIALEAAFEALTSQDFAGRIAMIDRAAADAAGVLAARREARGETADVRDTLIGGIALARRAAIATRNIRHFSDPALSVIDPWS